MLAKFLNSELSNDMNDEYFENHIRFATIGKTFDTVGWALL